MITKQTHKNCMVHAQLQMAVSNLNKCECQKILTQIFCSLLYYLFLQKLFNTLYSTIQTIYRYCFLETNKNKILVRTFWFIYTSGFRDVETSSCYKYILSGRSKTRVLLRPEHLHDVRARLKATSHDM